MVRRIALALGLITAGLFLTGLARAQSPPGPIHPRPGVQPEAPPAPSEDTPRMRVRVDLVSAPVTVRDLQGDLILNLTQKDFRVYDNGVEQQVSHFDLGGDPLAVALVVETSSRVAPMLPAIRRAGIVFTETVMAQTAEAELIGYNDSVDLLQRFTMTRDTMQHAIEKLPEGTSGARLYDALSRAISDLEKEPASERRIIVVVGEPGDSGSEEKLGNILREAQLANIAIYTIGLSPTAAALREKPSQAESPSIGPPGTFPVPTPPGTIQTPQTEQETQGNIDFLSAMLWLLKTGANAVKSNSQEMLSRATGGMHIGTFRDRAIEKAFDTVGGELHTQYMLSYHPTGDVPTGYHEIKITVTRPDVKVRTRPGYYIAPPPA
ncbi:MAG: VWA domain-containing protein [Candidatus Acidiferrales bacterium]